MADANVERHAWTHFLYFEVCCKAERAQRDHRSEKGEVDPEETPSLHLGNRTKADRAIRGRYLTRGSGRASLPSLP